MMAVTSTRSASSTEGGPTSLFYQHNPLDVEGWRGDNFAFTFNIADYNVVSSDSVHLPPTVHLFMQATGVYVMNFLPRPVEGVAGTERSPGITATSTTTSCCSSTAARRSASRCRLGCSPMRHKAFTTGCRSGVGNAPEGGSTWRPGSSGR